MKWEKMEFLKNILSEQSTGNILALIGVLLIPMPAIFYFVRSKILKESKKAVGDAFRETVVGLSSSSLEIRMASAILLRRFFDKKSELGIGNTPFAKEAVHVIAAVLKTLQTNDFQKVLADSLRHAPITCLQNGDFQRANLSKAFLGANDTNPEDAVNMEMADFYQANLSGSSLRNAKLRGAQFYESQLTSTVFRHADLRNASFDSATLQGTDFRGANLADAKFDRAILRNVNFTGANIKGATFTNVSGYGTVGLADGVINFSPSSADASLKVFISRPGVMDVRQSLVVDEIKEVIRSLGFDPIELSRNDYDRSSVLSKLSGRLDGCGAMVVFGFKAVHVGKGVYRYNTDDSREMADEFLSTPWNHIEAGMGLMKKIPVLLLADEGVNDGIFDTTVNDSLLERHGVSECLRTSHLNVRTWLGAIGCAQLPQSVNH